MAIGSRSHEWLPVPDSVEGFSVCADCQANVKRGWGQSFLSVRSGLPVPESLGQHDRQVSIRKDRRTVIIDWWLSWWRGVKRFVCIIGRHNHGLLVPVNQIGGLESAYTAIIFRFWCSLVSIRVPESSEHEIDGLSRITENDRLGVPASRPYMNTTVHFPVYAVR